MSDSSSQLPADVPADEPETDGSESKQVTLAGEAVSTIATFSELNLRSEILDSLAAANFVKPTPIQAQFIPQALTGRDVMGQAKTGTGKTAAFLLPIFQKIAPHKSEDPDRRCQALILAPTRELALQIHGEINRLGSTLGYASITLYGGASYEPQIEALSAGVDIVVGTPGRIMDHMRSHRLDLSEVKVAVLDEADRMLDLGFRKDIEYILRHCPSERQTLLLSATIPDEIKKLSKRFMNDPLEVWTAPESLTVDSVEQHFFVCEKQDKLPILLKLLETENPPLAIIFCGTKIGAKKLAEKLTRLYISAREIHGDLQQSKRERILGGFRTGKVRLLIATDVASRGIDVQNITHIINWDIPYKIEDYVHRIGRTGRMERKGKAYTFVTREEGSYLTEIELLINREIHRMHFDDLTSRWWPNPPKEPDPSFMAEEPEPAQAQAPAAGGGKRRRRRGGRRGRDGESAPQASAPGGDVQTPAAADAGAQPSDIEGDNSGEESSGSESGGGSERRRRPRRRRTRGEPITITCSQCGAQATVTFKPSPDRPVYCEACFQNRKSARMAAQPAEPPVSDQSATAG